ncbi:transglutaminase-like domain-containing protein [Flavonifractor porci]|uniref:transglutaminase-like domain-containing protein n=1 Tax=Flavonifractor porci TaxID=3133422 RepID=UPI0030B7A7E8
MDQELTFIRQALPEDWDSYPQSLFEAFAAHSRMLRQNTPWCASLSQEAYEQYVLCPRVNDEDLSDHRALFYSQLWDRVKDLSQEEAALEVNRWCHEQASYQAQDDRTASPLTVYRCGSGRCGEESAFLVSALRSVGLAARQVYAPRWSHCDDNHAWVEVLCEGRWHFLGACEPEPVLDRGWFNTAASRAMLVHSRTFGPVADLTLHGAPLSKQGQALYHNQTARYAHTKSYTFRAQPGEIITLEVLNESRFCPIAALTADETGRVQVELGISDLHLSAGEKEAFCHGQTQDVAKLTLPSPCTDWTAFDFRAPQDAPVNPAPLDQAQRQERAAVLAAGTAKRQERMAGYFDEEKAQNYPRQRELLQKARGNFGEIYAFLSKDHDPLRPALLSSLSDKDLRDVTADLLEVHLERARPWADRYPAEVFRRFVLCPRVAFEPITDWSVPQPGAVGEVIALRQQGVPALLRPLDGAVLMWQDGKFVPKEPEECGKVTFRKAPVERFLYRQNWSLDLWTGEMWKPLRLADRAWHKNKLNVTLPAGRYRVLTALRLPAGDQFANRLEFTLEAGQEREIPLALRDCSVDDLISPRELPLEELGGPHEKAALLLWLEEGAEPTEHILNELSAALPAFQALDGDVVFFLRRPGAEQQATLAGLLDQWPQVQLFYPEWGYQVETVARHLGLDPDKPPLAVVRDQEGRAAYACCGYQVGAADLLRRVLEQLV